METSQVLTIIISIVVSTVTLLGGLMVILHRATNKRIDDVNKRIDDVSKRIGDVNKRIDDVNKRIDDLRDIVLTINESFTPSISPKKEKGRLIQNLRCVDISSQPDN